MSSPQSSESEILDSRADLIFASSLSLGGREQEIMKCQRQSSTCLRAWGRKKGPLPGSAQGVGKIEGSGWEEGCSSPCPRWIPALRAGDGNAGF